MSKTIDKKLTDQLHKNRFTVREIKSHHKFKPIPLLNYVSQTCNSNSTVETYQSELWTLEVDVDDLRKVLKILSMIEEENELIDRYPSVRKAFEQYEITTALVKGNNYD